MMFYFTLCLVWVAEWPPFGKLFITDRSKAMVLMWFSVACFGVRVLMMFYFTLCLVWVAEWPPFGKFCPLGWPYVPIVFCLYVF